MKRKISLKIILSTFCLFLFLTLARADTDTLASYIDLELYSGAADSIYLTHERYFGLFINQPCTTEDYGTRILTNTGCWQRDFQNFSPRYWEIGGNSPSNFIGQVRREVDAINSAVIAAYDCGGDTIEISEMYEIDRSVFLLPGNTYLGMSDSVGFRRIDSPKTVLKYNTQIGDDQIIVDSNQEFRTYQKINIANDIAYDSIAGFVSYTASVPFSGFGGDTTIFLSGLPIQKEMNAGDSVGLFFPIMTNLFGPPDSVLLKNLILDGNRDSYTLNYDWRTNVGINSPTTHDLKIDNCKFYNSAAENMFLCGAEVINCSGENFNGSVLHFSCNTFDRPTEVLYNDFSHTNEIGDSLMEHSEAAFTFSAKVQNLRVAYNRLIDLQEHGIGQFQNDDKFNEITDNLFSTPKEKILYQAFYNQDSTNIIYNNKNPLTPDTSSTECILHAPQIEGIYPCNRASSFNNPLVQGDTIELVFDYIQVSNSRENYLKCITPLYNNDYFSLTDMMLTTPDISQYHQWSYDAEGILCEGLTFDNGHRDGIASNGNWGYEPCGEEGKCQALKMKFTVISLPERTDSVSCPLEGIEIVYDGELGTWDSIPNCENKLVYYSPEELGSPVIQGDTSVVSLDFQPDTQGYLYPNPTSDVIFLLDYIDANSKYSIFDRTGSKVQNGIMKEGSIDVQTLRRGFYFLSLESAEGQILQTLEFVKE